MKTNSQDYAFSFTSSKSPEIIFDTLLDIKAWWSGIYSEKIEGKSSKLNDQFTFSAGGGAHYTKQRLTELIPEKKIVWLVAESNLSFLKNPSEWENTKISFEISGKGNETQIVFTHSGLVSKLECYDACTEAWGQYLNNLSEKLK
jgi:hypothetical protein